MGFDSLKEGKRNGPLYVPGATSTVSPSTAASTTGRIALNSRERGLRREYGSKAQPCSEVAGSSGRCAPRPGCRCTCLVKGRHIRKGSGNSCLHSSEARPQGRRPVEFHGAPPGFTSYSRVWGPCLRCRTGRSSIHPPGGQCHPGCR